MKKLLIGIIIPAAVISALSRPAPKSAALGPGRKYTSVERMQRERLRAVHDDRVRFAAAKHKVRLSTGYRDYRGILHAHAGDSSHTGGTRDELLAAAKRSGVSVIMLSDHVREGRDFIDGSWRGLRDGVLFIPGAENDGFLVYPTASLEGKKWDSRASYISLVKENGGNIFLSHVEERFDWPTDRMDGLEIYNHHTDVKDEAEFTRWLRSSLTDPVRLRHLERALADFPQEVFGAQQDYLAAIIEKWDRDTQNHRLTGIAANDCHHNQGFTLTASDGNSIEIGFITNMPTSIKVSVEQIPGVAELLAGRQAGQVIAKLDFDPYERSLVYITTHFLTKELTEQAMRSALKQGRVYVAHDWLCDPTGFAFAAIGPNDRLLGVMGDGVSAGRSLLLRAETPLKCWLKLYRNGSLVKTELSDYISFGATAPGVYRVEAWLTVDGESRPWIYSNPIYVR